jgi:calcium-dependent protein kinase
MGTIVGTPYYVAPEVFKQHYGKECDIWSAGVILYILLSGQFPFEGTSNTEILRNVMKGDFNLASGVWTRISIHAKDLIKKMLTKNPAHRISAELALKHPWFDNATEEMITIDPNILQTLREYKA